MRKFQLLLFSVWLVLSSCNSITSGHYLLTDENADYLAPKYEFWYSNQIAEDLNEMPLQLQDFETTKKSKLWVIQPYPNDKKEQPGYLRVLQLENKKILFQFTTWEKEKLILYFFGKRLNDSTFSFYALNKDAIEKAKKSNLLAPLKNGVQFKSDEIYFDSITSINNRDRILEFLENEMSQPSYFEKDSLILRGSNDAFRFIKSKN